MMKVSYNRSEFRSREQSLEAARKFKVKDKEDLYDYYFYHYYDYEESNCYVRLPFPPHIMEVLMVYIQYYCGEIDMDYELDYEVIEKVLTEFYGGTMIKKATVRPSALALDLYFTWEKWCGLSDEVLRTHSFNREGLKDFLEKQVLESSQSIS